MLESIEVQISFDESDAGHPVVQDIFPKTSFEDEGWKVSGKVGVGIGGFVKNPVAKATAEATLGFSFEYTPLVARIISDGIGNQATWRIREVKDRQPVGQIDYYFIVLVPREMRDAVATLSLTLWFDEGDQKFVRQRAVRNLQATTDNRETLLVHENVLAFLRPCKSVGLPELSVVFELFDYAAEGARRFGKTDEYRYFSACYRTTASAILAAVEARDSSVGREVRGW